MQLVRLVGTTISNKPIYGYKKPKQLNPEQYFGLPKDKITQIPLATKKQSERARNKARLLKGVI